MNDLISIIIPIFNVEKYLERCLASIEEQTYLNIEVILIDDGSPDNSKIIYKNFLQKNPKWKLIKQKNSGLSAARNAGIKISNGKYICFIDSDDYVSKNYVEQLYAICIRYKATISACGNIQFHSQSELDSKIDSNKTKIPKTQCLQSHEAIGKLLSEQIFTSAWGKLFHRKLFENVRFHEGKTMEDMLIMPILFHNANIIAVTDRPLYFYSQENLNSITRKNFNEKHLELADASLFWKEFVSKFYPSLNRTASYHYSKTLIDLYTRLIKSNYNEGNLENVLKFQIKASLDYTISNYDFRTQVKILLIKFNVYKIIRQICC